MGHIWYQKGVSRKGSTYLCLNIPVKLGPKEIEKNEGMCRDRMVEWKQTIDDLSKDHVVVRLLSPQMFIRCAVQCINWLRAPEEQQASLDKALHRSLDNCMDALVPGGSGDIATAGWHLVMKNITEDNKDLPGQLKKNRRYEFTTGRVEADRRVIELLAGCLQASLSRISKIRGRCLLPPGDLPSGLLPTVEKVNDLEEKMKLALEDLHTQSRVPCRILVTRSPAVRTPEILLALYYTAGRRMPAPFEVMVCSDLTTESQAEHFIRRWEGSVNMAQVGMDHPLMYTMANIEAMPYSSQVRLVQELQTAVERLTAAQKDRELQRSKRVGAGAIPSLVLLHSAASVTSFCLSSLQYMSQEMGLPSLDGHPLKDLVGHILTRESEGQAGMDQDEPESGQAHGQRAIVVASPHPGSGKTRLVRSMAANQESDWLYCTYPLEPECDRHYLLPLLRRLADPYLIDDSSPPRPRLVHLNLSHGIKPPSSISPPAFNPAVDINELLLQVIIGGFIEDEDHTPYMLTRPQDLLVIEVPSEGVPDRLDPTRGNPLFNSMPLLKCLPMQQPEINKLHWTVPEPMPVPDLPAHLQLYEVRTKVEPLTRQCLLVLHYLKLRFTLGESEGFPMYEYQDQHRNLQSKDFPGLVVPQGVDPYPAKLQPSDLLDSLNAVLDKVQDKEGGDGGRRRFQYYQKLRLLQLVRKGLCQLIDQEELNLKNATGSSTAHQRLQYSYAQLLLLLKTAKTNAMCNVDPPSEAGFANHAERFAKIRQWDSVKHLYPLVHRDRVTTVNLSEKSLFDEMTGALEEGWMKQGFMTWYRDQPADGLDLNRKSLQEQLGFPEGFPKKQDAALCLLGSRRVLWEKLHITDMLDVLELLKQLKQKASAKGSAKAAELENFAANVREAVDRFPPCLPRLREGKFESWTDLKEGLSSLIADVLRPSFMITENNFTRMIAIWYRIQAGMSVIFQGETGCGKTTLVRFFVENIMCLPLTVINVNGGYSADKLQRDLAPLVALAYLQPDERHVVFLDEVNTCPHQTSVKELLCDGFLLGQRFPPNISFICCINPYQRDTHGSKASSAGGLNYNHHLDRISKMDPTHADKVKARLSAGPGSLLRNLVYSVHQIPETLLTLVWDIGSPADHPVDPQVGRNFSPYHPNLPDQPTDETLCAEAVCRQVLLTQFWPAMEQADRKWSDKHKSAAIGILLSAVCAAQTYIRDEVHGGQQHAISLRDINRCLSICDWTRAFCEKAHQANGSREGSLPEAVKIPNPAKAPEKVLTHCFLTGLHCTYALRLSEDHKLALFAAIGAAWRDARGQSKRLPKDLLPSPTDDEDFVRPFKLCCSFLVSALNPGHGVAMNQAMRENTFMLFQGITAMYVTGGGASDVHSKSSMTFLIGRPGTSKSLSWDVLYKAWNKQSPFFSLYPDLRPFSVQCSPAMTSQSITAMAENAGGVQASNNKGLEPGQHKVVCVLVLEEVGVAALSPHLPLMTLHELIDRGVLVDGQWVRLPIIGISNWNLDAAKMNRGVIVSRGKPSVDDLFQTASSMLDSRTSDRDGAQGRVSRILSDSEGPLKALAELMSSKVIAEEDYNWFYGLRDFYAVVQFLQGQMSSSMTAVLEDKPQATTMITPHMAIWALHCNLSGLPDREKQSALMQQMLKALINTDRSCSEAAEWESLSAAWCDPCFRAHLHTLALRQWCKGESKDTPQRVYAAGHGGPSRHLLKSTCEGYSRVTDSARQCALPTHSSGGSHDTMSLEDSVGLILSDSSSRHLLVSTNGREALYLLFDMGLCHWNNTSVIAGSCFGGDQKDLALYGGLQELQMCMRTGKLAVLSDCAAFYESLYDMLNQHYLKDKGDTFARLSVGAHSQYFKIMPSFRCVIIVDESEIPSLEPPFLNRMCKVHMTMESVMKPNDKVLLQHIKKHLTFPSKIPTGPQSKETLVDLCKPLLHFFDQQTLPSLCLAMAKRAEGLGQAVMEKDMQKNQMQDLSFLRVLWRISWASSTETYLPHYYLVMQPHESLDLVLNHGLEALARWRERGQNGLDAEDEHGAEDKQTPEELDLWCPWGDEAGLHLVVSTTENHGAWLPAAVKALLHNQILVGNHKTIHEPVSLLLNQATSEKDVEQQLQWLYDPDTATDPDARWLFVMCDTTSAPKRDDGRITILDHVRMLVSKHCHEFKEKALGPDCSFAGRHIVLLYQVPPMLASLPKEQTGLSGDQGTAGLSLTFDDRWHHVFVDAVCPSSELSDSDLSLKKLASMPLVEVTGQADQADQAGEPLLSDKVILDLLSGDDTGYRLRYPHPEDLEESKKIQLLQKGIVRLRKLIGKMQSASGSGVVQSSVQLLVDRIRKEFEAHPLFGGLKWARVAMTHFDAGLSVRCNLIACVGRAVRCVFTHLVACCDAYQNLDLALHAKTAALWCNLANAVLPGAGAGVLPTSGHATIQARGIVGVPNFLDSMRALGNTVPVQSQTAAHELRNMVSGVSRSSPPVYSPPHMDEPAHFHPCYDAQARFPFSYAIISQVETLQAVASSEEQFASKLLVGTSNTSLPRLHVLWWDNGPTLELLVELQSYLPRAIKTNVAKGCSLSAFVGQVLGSVWEDHLSHDPTAEAAKGLSNLFGLWLRLYSSAGVGGDVDPAARGAQGVLFSVKWLSVVVPKILDATVHYSGKTAPTALNLALQLCRKEPPKNGEECIDLTKKWTKQTYAGSSDLKDASVHSCMLAHTILEFAPDPVQFPERAYTLTMSSGGLLENLTAPLSTKDDGKCPFYAAWCEKAPHPGRRAVPMQFPCASTIARYILKMTRQKPSALVQVSERAWGLKLDQPVAILFTQAARDQLYDQRLYTHEQLVDWLAWAMPAESANLRGAALPAPLVVAGATHGAQLLCSAIKAQYKKERRRKQSEAMDVDGGPPPSQADSEANGEVAGLGLLQSHLLDPDPNPEEDLWWDTCDAAVAHLSSVVKSLARGDTDCEKESVSQLYAFIAHCFSENGSDLEAARLLLKWTYGHGKLAALESDPEVREFVAGEEKTASPFSLYPGYLNLYKAYKAEVINPTTSKDAVGKAMGKAANEETRAVALFAGVECAFWRKRDDQPYKAVLDVIEKSRTHGTRSQVTHKHAPLTWIRKAFEPLQQSPEAAFLFETEGDGRVVADIVTHTCCLVLQLGDKFDKFFKPLLEDPSQAGSLLWPAVDDSKHKECLEMFTNTTDFRHQENLYRQGAEHGNQYDHWVWVCPNNHPYVAVGCEHAVESLNKDPETGRVIPEKCDTCGAEVGGISYNNPYPGVRLIGHLKRHGYTDSVLDDFSKFAKEYNFPVLKGFRKSTADPALKERSLSSIGYRVLRIIIDSVLLGAAVQHGLWQESWTAQETKQQSNNPQICTRQEMAEHLLLNLNALRDTAFPDSVGLKGAVTLYHAMLKQLWLQRKKVKWGNMKTTECRHAFEKSFQEEVVDQLSAPKVNPSMVVIEAQETQATSLDQVKDTDFVLRIRKDRQFMADRPLKFRPSSPHLWLVLPRIDLRSMFGFLNTITGCGLLQAMAQPPVQAALLCLPHAPVILPFLCMVQHKMRGCTRAGAESTKLGQLISANSLPRDAFNAFKTGFSVVWQYLKNCPAPNACVNLRHKDETRHIEITEETTVDYLLPHSTGVGGMVCQAIYHTLSMMQVAPGLADSDSVAETVDLLKLNKHLPHSLMMPVVSFQETPLVCRPSDVVDAELPEKFCDMLLLYAARNTVMPSGSPVTFLQTQALQEHFARELK
eukprot:gene12735-355_t